MHLRFGTVCVPERPVNAIFAEENVSADQQDFIALNTELSPKWKVTTGTKAVLPDADVRASVMVKRSELER